MPSSLASPSTQQAPACRRPRYARRALRGQQQQQQQHLQEGKACISSSASRGKPPPLSPSCELHQVSFRNGTLVSEWPTAVFNHVLFSRLHCCQQEDCSVPTVCYHRCRRCLRPACCCCCPALRPRPPPRGLLPTSPRPRRSPSGLEKRKRRNANHERDRFGAWSSTCGDCACIDYTWWRTAERSEVCSACTTMSSCRRVRRLFPACVTEGAALPYGAGPTGAVRLRLGVPAREGWEVHRQDGYAGVGDEGAAEEGHVAGGGEWREGRQGVERAGSGRKAREQELEGDS